MLFDKGLLPKILMSNYDDCAKYRKLSLFPPKKTEGIQG
jgi:hypothetical protein